VAANDLRARRPFNDLLTILPRSSSKNCVTAVLSLGCPFPNCVLHLSLLRGGWSIHSVLVLVSFDCYALKKYHPFEKKERKAFSRRPGFFHDRDEVTTCLVLSVVLAFSRSSFLEAASLLRRIPQFPPRTKDSASVLPRLSCYHEPNADSTRRADPSRILATHIAL
jgi:hypothetical protein